jgi:uncharacterized repeat protein (TIGR03803 family)
MHTLVRFESKTKSTFTLPVSIALLATAIVCARADEAVIYSFKGTPDGANPQGRLVSDDQSVLYGATEHGGLDDKKGNTYGTIFQLTPSAAEKPKWSHKVLYRFKGGHDGASSLGGLIIDHQGALYGTTPFGGDSNHGDVFKLTPSADKEAEWTKTVLYNFKGAPDGAIPKSHLVFDNQGAIYGTTTEGGLPLGVSDFTNGIVFKLTPPKAGDREWVESVLYRFNGNLSNNFANSGHANSVILDDHGALYGTVSETTTLGYVFKLTPPGPDQPNWKETILHNFTGSPDGEDPSNGDLVLDDRGALYGATTRGGPTDGQNTAGGTVFKLSPPGQGTEWVETQLANFQGPADEISPNGDLVFDGRGALFGTTSGGPDGDGSIFIIVPTGSGSGQWVEALEHNFSGKSDGRRPSSGLIDRDGTMYGTTYEGGTSGFGAIFQFRR